VSAYDASTAELLIRPRSCVLTTLVWVRAARDYEGYLSVFTASRGVDGALQMARVSA